MNTNKLSSALAVCTISVIVSLTGASSFAGGMYFGGHCGSYCEPRFSHCSSYSSCYSSYRYCYRPVCVRDYEVISYPCVKRVYCTPPPVCVKPCEPVCVKPCEPVCEPKCEDKQVAQVTESAPEEKVVLKDGVSRTTQQEIDK